MPRKNESPDGKPDLLFTDIARLITESKSVVAQTVNGALTLLYWKVGKRINGEVLRHKRAGYGNAVVATLGKQLSEQYGSSFSEKNIRRMMQFHSVFPDEQIVVSAIRQLIRMYFVDHSICDTKSRQQIELFQLGKSGIKVAEYLTALPDKGLLQQKLHTLIETERKRIENL